MATLVRDANGRAYPVRATAKPCEKCKKEIQPGQLYLPGTGKDGPRHVGCSR